MSEADKKTLIDCGVPPEDAEDWLEYMDGDLNDALNTFFTTPNAIVRYRQAQAKIKRREERGIEMHKAKYEKGLAVLAPDADAALIAAAQKQVL